MDDIIKRLLVSNCNETLKHTTFYILPFFQLIALAVNFSSAVIFLSWKHPLYRYLGANSIVDGILFILNIFLSQSLCKRDPNFILTYRFQIFELYFIFYLQKVVETISTIIKIQIATDRYLIIKNGFWSKIKIKKRLISIVIFSTLIHSYYLFFVKVRKVYKLNNETYTFSELKNSNETTFFYVSFLTETARSSKLIQLILIFGHYILSLTFLALMITFSTLLYFNFKKSQKTTGFIVKFKNNGIRRDNNNSRRVQFTKNRSNNFSMIFLTHRLISFSADDHFCI
jgi:hypothetical protein